jgi:hypothetical protein
MITLTLELPGERPADALMMVSNSLSALPQLIETGPRGPALDLLSLLLDVQKSLVRQLA